jgi:putative endonuclease
LSFHVYVLESQSTGRRYVGQTGDLALRLVQHNDPADRLTLHTKRHPGPWQLIVSARRITS